MQMLMLEEDCFSKLSFKMGGWCGKHVVANFRQVNCMGLGIEHQAGVPILALS